jgi:hypothetical protein
VSQEAVKEILLRAELARRLADATTQRDDRALLLELAALLESEAAEAEVPIHPSSTSSK